MNKIRSLDEFSFQLKLLSELESVLKLILVLGLGQVSFEREYNVNNLVLKFSMSQDSVVATKLLIYHMQKRYLKPSTIETLSRLIKAVKPPCQRYNTHLEKQKKNPKQKRTMIRQTF